MSLSAPHCLTLATDCSLSQAGAGAAHPRPESLAPEPECGLSGPGNTGQTAADFVTGTGGDRRQGPLTHEAPHQQDGART